MEDLKYMILGSTLNICSAISGGYFMENLKVLKQLKPNILMKNPGTPMLFRLARFL